MRKLKNYENLETVERDSLTNGRIVHSNIKTREVGITLIALVVTIVILLILAGISIAALSDNGLFGKTKEAKNQNNYSVAYEELSVKITSIQIDKQGEATFEDIIKELNEDEENTYAIYLESRTAKLSNGGDITSSDIDTLASKLEDKEEIYIFYKGYEFKIDKSLKVENKLSTASTPVEEPPAPKYTITYDTNGGVLSGDNEVEIQKGETYGELPQPTRTKCTFEGWYTSKKVSEGTKINASDEYTLDEDQTLYAIWSHTHTTASGATLVSGTALANDGAYNKSGGCYTTSSTYSAACGSGSWSVVSVTGGAYYNTKQVCPVHTTTYTYWKGYFTWRCNSCSATVSKEVSPSNYCPTCYRYFGGYTDADSSGKKYGICPGFTMYEPQVVGYCSNTVSKTKYTRSCGLTSGILDQD